MITFPRPMPSMGAVGQMFELQRVDFSAPEAGGRLGGVQAGFPLWSMSLDLTNMDDDTADIWRAWHSVQRGSQRPFFAFDLKRPVPKRHIGGRPFTKTAASWSQSINADGLALLTLTGMMPGTILGLGDYVGFRWDGAGDEPNSFKRRSLTRTVAGSSVNAAGSITIAVEPPIPPLVPISAQAHLDNPMCVMRLLPETQLGTQVRGYTAAGGQIVAVEDLRP